jgi:hypothetical protein
MDALLATTNHYAAFRRIARIRCHQATAKMSYPLDRTSKASLPDRTYSPSAITTATNWFVGPKGKALHRKRISNAQGGSLAQPGKVLSKEDRQKRIQSASATQPEPAKSFQEQRAEDLSFRKLYESLKSWRVLHAINASFRDNLAPEAAATTAHEFQFDKPLSPARHLIVLIISFLIVFGLGWNAITYFITVTSVSAQCTASTVYSTITVSAPVTVTYTYTESIFLSPTACTTTSADVDPAATKSDPSTTIMPMSTSTSTSFSTTTVTVFSATPSESSVSTSSTLPYVFSVNSGTTSWINGVSPSSGALLITATTTVFITPSETPDQLSTLSTTSQTTRTQTTTITPPAETSTSTTFVGPDLTLTTHITRTSTVTPTSTVTRSSFGGMGGSGWNMTSSQYTSNVGNVTAAAAQGTPTTATISYFWASSGGQTYSTSTQVITTTLYHSHVSGWMPTVPPMSTSISDSPASRNSSSTMTDVDGYSSFPTMSPGTDGINPASGAGTASSGPAITSPESVSSPVLGMTGFATGLMSTPSSVVPAPNATASNVGISPESATGAEAETDPSAAPSVVSSSEGAPQNASSAVLANSLAPTSSLGAGSTEPSGTGASEVGAAGTSMDPSASDVSSNPTSPTAMSSMGSMTASSSSTAFANASLTSVFPSTQALTSIGSSLANGSAVPTSSNVSSVTPSSQATSSSTYISDSTTMTSSKTSASASVSPTACGEHGDFTLDFDDLPAFSGDEDITQAPPIFSPYHHLTFSSGYVHQSQRSQPFAPHSGDQLAVFLAPGNGTNDTTWHQNGLTMNAPRTEPGEITDGPYDGMPAFWFNAKGAWLGCDNDGPEPCVFNVTGWTWNSQLGDEVATYNTQIELPPCPGFENCQLQQVSFPENFRGLSGIQIQAFANNQPRMFFMDDLALSWFDNSCAAGMQRMGRPGSFGGPGRSGGGGRKRVVRRSLMR